METSLAPKRSVILVAINAIEKGSVMSDLFDQGNPATLFDGAVSTDVKERMPWPDPTPEMLEDPVFNAIWNTIKHWDINVPTVYEGYCGATGNHVRAILDAVRVVQTKP